MRNIKLFWVCFGNFIPSSIWLCWYSCYIKIDPYTPKVNLPESVNQVLKDHEEPKFQMNFRSFIFFINIIIIIIYMVCFSCFMKKNPDQTSFVLFLILKSVFKC